ncbi:transcription elongation factor TFIIS [Malassezia pachydermatis]
MATAIEKTKELNKQLAKASTDARTDDVLSLLKQLKEVVEPTEDLIRATKIGVAVGKLRTYSDARVSEMAKDMVKSWKAHVEKQRRESATKEKAKKEASAPSDTANAPSNATNVDINFEVLNDKVRNACLKLLYNSFELHPDADAQKVYASAMDIEKAAYLKIGASTVNADYKAKIRSLSLNLKDKNNPELRDKVLNGDIDGEKLVTMRSEELASSALKAHHESIRLQNLHNAKGAEAQEAETDAFQCGKCKKRKTRYYQMQTRSADEPMTTFVTCVNCNNKWKFC